MLETNTTVEFETRYNWRQFISVLRGKNSGIFHMVFENSQNL